LLSAVKQSRVVIKAEYEKLRDETKRECMLDVSEPLDRHKCAACFMVAFMKKLKIPSLEQSPSTSKLFREKMAIDVGLNILITMIRCDTRATNAEFIDFLDNSQNLFVFPDILCDERPYEHNWALGLYYDRQKERLSVLSLSNTLFWVESYNRQLAASAG
jgi:hypothetical protein